MLSKLLAGAVVILFLAVSFMLYAALVSASRTDEAMGIDEGINHYPGASKREAFLLMDVRPAAGHYEGAVPILYDEDGEQENKTSEAEQWDRQE